MFKLIKFVPVAFKSEYDKNDICKICRGKILNQCFVCLEKNTNECPIIIYDNYPCHKHCVDTFDLIK